MLHLQKQIIKNAQSIHTTAHTPPAKIHKQLKLNKHNLLKQHSLMPFITPEMTSIDNYLLNKLQQHSKTHNHQWKSLGLEYFPNVLSRNNENAIVKFASEQSIFNNFQLLLKKDKYHFLSALPKTNEIRYNISQILNIEQARLTELSHNYYHEDQNFLEHQDILTATKQIAVVSLGSPAIVHFRHWVTNHKFSICVEPRSMYVMSGAVRYEYTHLGSSLQKEILNNGLRDHVSWTRGSRFSLPFAVDFEYTSSKVGSSQHRREIDNLYSKVHTLQEYLEICLAHESNKMYQRQILNLLNLLKQNYKN